MMQTHDERSQDATEPITLEELGTIVRSRLDAVYERWADERSVTELMETLADADPAKRAHSAAILQTRGAEAAPAVPALRKALQDPDGEVRFGAALALAEVEEHAIDALPDLIVIAGRDSEGCVRGAATHAIFRLGVVADISAAQEALVARLRDDEPTVRYNACWALACLHAGAADAVPALSQRVRTDVDRVIRAAAASTLHLIGSAAASALSAVRDALSDPDRDVRNWAARAVGAISAISGTSATPGRAA